MTKIYTKTGDDGSTGLIGGRRLSKSALRVEAFGTVDELNALLGVVLSSQVPERVKRILLRIQDDLFTVGANLAAPDAAAGEQFNISPITEEDIRALEVEVDECEATLEALQRFILPGGGISGAHLHLARAIARRAERRCVALARAEQVDPKILRYLNRLSDLCFVLARFVNKESGCLEISPTFGKR